MKAPSVKPVRCAIYTRVSTEHGLDQAKTGLLRCVGSAAPVMAPSEGSLLDAKGGRSSVRFDSGWKARYPRPASVQVLHVDDEVKGLN